jgi:hypothetical protein
LEAFLRESRKQQRKKGDQATKTADVRFLCEAAEAVFFRRPDTGKLIRLTKDGRPVTLNAKTLGEILKLDDEAKKNSVTLLDYLVKGNGIALGNMASTVAKWMTNTSAEVEEAVLGE